MKWYKMLGIAVLAAIIMFAAIKVIALLVKMTAFMLVVLALLAPVMLLYGVYTLFKKKKV